MVFKSQFQNNFQSAVRISQKVAFSINEFLNKFLLRRFFTISIIVRLSLIKIQSTTYPMNSTMQSSFSATGASNYRQQSSIAPRRNQMNQNSDYNDINAHIDNLDLNMINLNSEMKQKSALYETEIENIQEQIKLAKTAFDKELAQQKKDQEQEIKEIQKQHAEEIQALEVTLRKVQSRKENFSTSRSQIERIKRESELADLRHKLEILQIQQEDKVYLESTTVSRNHGDNYQQEMELRAQIEMLDAEIADIDHARKQELEQFKMKLLEANQLFEKRNKASELKLQRYQAEVEKRQRECEEYINNLKNQAEFEEKQLQNEINTANEKLQGLAKLYANMQAKGDEEYSKVNQGIKELKEAIEKAKQRESEQIEETRQQIAKYRAAQHETIAIEQEVLSLKQEIEDLRRENQEMRKERNRIENVTYTNRISKFRTVNLQ